MSLPSKSRQVSADCGVDLPPQMQGGVEEIDGCRRKRCGHQSDGNREADGLLPPLAFVTREFLGLHIEI